MFLPFTPTELQVSNKINQPLKKKQKKNPAVGASRGGARSGWAPRKREDADGQRVSSKTTPY